MSEKGKMPTGDILYLLSGEFDNKYGPSIVCEYPTSIPGFSTVEGDSEAANAALLASLMIPNSTEHCGPTEPDCNIFTLFLNKNTGKYQMLPTLGEESIESNTGKPSRINFINVVKTQHDSSNSRGARIRSIAVGSVLTSVDALRPFLSQALAYIMQATDASEVEKVLMNCSQALNSLDISSIKASAYNNPIQQMLCSIRDRKSLISQLTDNTQVGRDILKIIGVSNIDEKRKGVSCEKGKVRLDFVDCSIDAQFKGLIEKPVEVSLFKGIKSELMTGESSICKFLTKFIPMLKTLPSDQFSFRLFVNSHRLPKYQICQFVEILSQLMGCFIEDGQTKYYDDTPVLVLPYAEVSLIKHIGEYFRNCDGHNSFAIIGTANSIFQQHTNLWDFYYDIDDDVLSTPINQTAGNRNSLWDNNLLKKFLQKNVADLSSYHITETRRKGLLTAFLDLINEENAKAEYILPILERINILQIEGHLRYTGDVASSFCSSYVTAYRDLVKFNAFFAKKSLLVIRYLSNLDGLITDLFDSSITLMRRQDMLSRLLFLLAEILSWINTSDEMLMTFLNVGLNYSPFQSLCDVSLISEEFSASNLRHVVAETGKRYRSWISVLDDGSGANFLEKFTKIRVFDLLSMPLLMNPDIYKPNRVGDRSRDRSSADNLSISSVSSGSSDSETKRPRSMSLKWIMNLPKNIDNLIEGPSLLWADAASVTSSIGRVTSPRSSYTGSNSSVSSLPSTLSSEQIKSKDFRQKTENAKRLAVQILSRLKSHPMGNYLMNQSMNPLSSTLLKVFEAELVS